MTAGHVLHLYVHVLAHSWPLLLLDVPVAVAVWLVWRGRRARRAG